MVVVGIDEEKTNDASGELVNSILFNPIVIVEIDDDAVGENKFVVGFVLRVVLLLVCWKVDVTVGVGFIEVVIVSMDTSHLFPVNKAWQVHNPS